MKKLFLLVLFLEVFLQGEEVLSPLKQKVLDLKRQKVLENLEVERNSWISPVILSTTLQRNVDISNDESDSLDFGFSWSQDIYKSGGIEASIKQAKASSEVSLINLNIEMANYLKNIYMYKSQLNQNKLSVAQNNLTLRNRNIDFIVVKKEYEVGNKDITDLNRAILDKDSANATLISSKNTLKSTFYELKKLIGKKEVESIKLPNIELISKSEYLSEYLEIKQQNAQIEQNEAAYQVTKSSFLPTLAFNTSAKYNKYSGDKTDVNGDSYSYGLSLSMPLSYTAKEATEASWLELLKTKISLKDKKAEIEEEYESHMENIKTFKAKIALAKEMTDMYKELYKTTKAQFETGFKTQYDVESIENSLKIQTLEIKIQKQNILMEKIVLFFNVMGEKR